MKELTWQDILKSQQQDFINRLELSSNLDSYMTDFLKFSSVEICAESASPDLRGLNAEIIELSFCAEEEIDIFCHELFDEENADLALQDVSVNSQIDKLGAAAVKAYLFDLLANQIDTKNNEVDFYLTKNPKIGIKVKTKCLKKNIYQEGNENQLNEDIFDDFNPDSLAEALDIEWTILPEETEKNQILICVVFLTPIFAEELYRKYYKCLMAGFIPIEKQSNSQSFKMNDLFYLGGIRAYLESF